MLSSLMLPCGANVRVEWTGSKAAQAALKILQSHQRQLAVRVDNVSKSPLRSPAPSPSSPASSDASVGSDAPFVRCAALPSGAPRPPTPPPCRTSAVLRLRMRMDVDAGEYALPRTSNPAEPFFEPARLPAEPATEGGPWGRPSKPQGNP
eukprot:EG_transcript_40558